MGIGRFVEYKETRHDEGSIRPPIIVAYRQPVDGYIKNGSIRPPIIVAYRPLSFPVKCGGI